MRFFYEVMLGLIAVLSIVALLSPQSAMGGAICFTLAVGFGAVIYAVESNQR